MQSSRSITSLSSWLLLTVGLMLISPQAASAEGVQITPFLGYSVGGEFEDYFTGTKLSLSEDETYGFIISKDTAPGTQAEFFYSYQPSSLSASGAFTPGVEVDVDVEYFHIGGRQYLGEGTAKPFVVGSLGATHFDPHSSRLESETRFSIGLGGGVELGASERIGIRLEGRGFATFFDSDGAVFCGPIGCTVAVASQVLWQFEVLAGVTFKF
ncbi:hypothetical protein KAJ77_03025 [bacterium]|nr:hypothetical protein [bacterium]